MTNAQFCLFFFTFLENAYSNILKIVIILDLICIYIYTTELKCSNKNKTQMILYTYLFITTSKYIYIYTHTINMIFYITWCFCVKHGRIVDNWVNNTFSTHAKQPLWQFTMILLYIYFTMYTRCSKIDIVLSLVFYYELRFFYILFLEKYL